jgi:hypothetical protein
MDANDLKFIRIITPEAFNMIPRYLFEQIKDLGEGENRVDDIYAQGLSILMMPVIQGGILRVEPNPLVHIVVFADDEHVVKGFVWAEIDLVDKHIFVHALSLDKEYQSVDGVIENVVMDYLFKIPDLPEFKDVGLMKKIQLTTTRPRAYERVGCKRSKKILMEIENAGRRKQNESS